MQHVAQTREMKRLRRVHATHLAKINKLREQLGNDRILVRTRQTLRIKLRMLEQRMDFIRTQMQHEIRRQIEEQVFNRLNRRNFRHIPYQANGRSPLAVQLIPNGHLKYAPFITRRLTMAQLMQFYRGFIGASPLARKG